MSVQLRFNPATEQEASYYRLKESYRDVRGHVHSFIVLNIGAEWLCKQTIGRLGLEDFLRRQDWNENSIHAALSHLVVRTVYSPSEWATHRIMKENSAACELYSGNPDWTPGIYALYQLLERLYEIKDKLGRHLCRATDNLF